jgi:hypothetical protein
MHRYYLHSQGSCRRSGQSNDSICLLDAGVDVAALLSKVGINVNATSEKVGTVAIAYAAHKALSPVRFPPTVALTPVVARFLGNKGGDDPESNVSNGNGPSP